MLAVPEEFQLKVGRLGICTFPSGNFVYLGSAHGVGGLRARLAHHSRIAQAPHWHLDYLRPYAEITGGWMVIEAQINHPPLECAWSLSLAAMAGCYAPVAGFGASDCVFGCPAHLFALQEKTL